MPRRVRPIRAWKLAEAVAQPQGDAALVDAVVEQQWVRALGALPPPLPIIERWGLRDLVDQRCQPAGSAADLGLGLVTVVLVCTRLPAPQPPVHVEDRLGQTALPDPPGLAAARANDDRLARTLDALVPPLAALWQALAVRAISGFALDLSQLCYDLTSIGFCGDYDEADLIAYGYSRDHRPDRKQPEPASTVTAAGGVPLDYRALADGRTPVENLRRPRRSLAPLPARDPAAPSPLVISDRAMLTPSLRPQPSTGATPRGPMPPARPPTSCSPPPNRAMCPRSASPWSKVPWLPARSTSTTRSAFRRWSSAPWSPC